MWIAKLKLNSIGTLIGEKAVKLGISLFIFPLSYYYDTKWVIVHISGTLFGDPKLKKNFAKQLKKEQRTINFELNDDFFVGTIKEPEILKFAYNKEILYITPLYVSDQGYEIITLGCFRRDPLIKIADIVKKNYGGKLISIQQKNIKSISVMTLHPELTDKQKKAIELAIKNGYYEYPRKIELEKLAKIMKVSYSTYQAHLRKAEKSLIPFFFEKSI